MAMFDFITKALHRILPVREVEVPMLDSDLDTAIEWTLRDLGVLYAILERMGEGSGHPHDILSFGARYAEQIAIPLHRAWRDERARSGYDNDVCRIEWLKSFL